MRRIAIVNQRYGVEVNGGSEYYTRMLAERLAEEYDVTVLTTCAEDYISWRNVYPVGKVNVNGVKVHRFPVKKERNPMRFRILDRLVRNVPVMCGLLETLWAKEQGPYAPELLAYIKDNVEEFDSFIFVTYLYYLTIKGLPSVAEKSILIPTAHDEPYLHFSIYRKVFQTPKHIVYLTEEEKKLVQQTFSNGGIPSIVAGMGIEVPATVVSQQFCKKYGISGDYIVYVGRIDEGKNCAVMFEQFLAYKKATASDVRLVLIGKAVMPIPVHPDIISVGFIPEGDKYAAIAGSKALWLPSRYESLSIVTLEAMALGVPVLVNGACEVLKAHCVKSGAGLYYQEAEELMEALQALLNQGGSRSTFCTAGKNYVKKNYNWEGILSRFREILP